MVVKHYLISVGKLNELKWKFYVVSCRKKILRRWETGNGFYSSMAIIALQYLIVTGDLFHNNAVTQAQSILRGLVHF